MTMIEFQNKIDHFIDRYCEQYHYSGVLRITHRDQVLYERSMGYADWEKKIPMDRNRHFTMYSLSKPFCAIGLLLLVDQGLVSLDAHPAVYVPEAAGFDSRVTIRNMLLHSSGMPDFGKYMRELDIPNTNWYGKARELVLADAKFPQEFVPGTNTQYANINFTLAALVIENVTGMAYADYMRERVFEPLGMLNTLVDRPGLDIADRAVGHDYSGDRILRKDCDVSWMLGAGDVLSTVADVYRLNLAIKHRKLLTPETWEQVLTPSPLSQFGFGCSVTQWHGKRESPTTEVIRDSERCIFNCRRMILTSFCCPTAALVIPEIPSVRQSMLLFTEKMKVILKLSKWMPDIFCHLKRHPVLIILRSG